MSAFAPLSTLVLDDDPASRSGHHDSIRARSDFVATTAARLLGESHRSIRLPSAGRGQLTQAASAEAWSLALMERLTSREAQAAASDGSGACVLVAR